MFAGIWAKLLLAGGTLLALGVIVLRAMGVLKKAGIDQQKAEDAAASQAAQQRMQDAQDHGPRDGDAAIERLRKHDA